ncbi:Peroxidase, family 2 [Seminavis robusta]|uniref:Peroxidase, family 2 n=1 Tax=Seminavis robusta TaxID=568900 RepID=A0A9N8E452_9STRA|nr:Peroxidase, family 2 [Seminavis robusta]|eukprot:Sro629_g178160.1 Peroxidase, family 2 (542) ;mRNA; f:10782-12495
MKWINVLHFFLFLGALAVTKADEGEEHPFYINHPYIPPNSIMARSPCPALNTLANHGFISRNGEGVTADDITVGFQKVFNLSPTFTAFQVGVAKSVGIPFSVDASGKESFKLIDLFLHNLLEHDASLVRQDEHFFHIAQYDGGLFQAMVQPAVDRGDEWVTREDIAIHLARRIRHSIRNNPQADFELDPGFVPRYAAEILSLFTFDDDANLERARITRLRSFMDDNRIPDDFVPRSTLGQTIFTSPFDPRFVSGVQYFAPVIVNAIASAAEGYVDSEMGGDPHLKTFAGEWFDYSGECDLKLIHVPQFTGGKDDLDIHVRTTGRYGYSYIESAAIRIGDDTLQVSSWGEYAVNGVHGARNTTAKLRQGRKQQQQQQQILLLGGQYPIYHKVTSPKTHVFDVMLGKGQNITFKILKDMVTIQIRHATVEDFGEVMGVLGDFHGSMLARDGVTDFSGDINAMGQEWQVRADEPKLFQTARAPQYPDKCAFPHIAKKTGRWLGEAISEDEAQTACAHLKKDDAHEFENCVYDVMATNDLDQALR